MESPSTRVLVENNRTSPACVLGPVIQHRSLPFDEGEIWAEDGESDDALRTGEGRSERSRDNGDRLRWKNVPPNSVVMPNP